MLSGIQTGKGIPHDKYNIRGTALAPTNRKEDIFMQRRLAQSFTYTFTFLGTRREGPLK